MAASAWLSLLALCLGPRSGAAVQTAHGGAAVTVPAGRAAGAKRTGTFYLGSDLPYDSCTAPYGCEVDQGIDIGGSVYSRGLYAHAASSINFTLNGEYERFISWIGIKRASHPECGISRGEASFEVKVDGNRLYYAASVDYNDAPIPLNLDVNFKMKMELITETNGDGTCDWTSWGDAKVTNDDSVTWDYLGTDVPIGSCTGYSCEVDKAHAADDIVIGGVVYPKGVATHATTTMTFSLTGGYTQFSVCYGVTESANGCGVSSGLIDFTISADGTQLHQGANKGPGSATCVKVDVTGKAQLVLLADKGTGGSCDHAGWGDAKLSTSPTESPTASPTKSPTASPTASPTTASPTASPTANPTASPTASPTEVAAIGDPHLTNMHGRKLELHRTGNVTLLQIPKAATTADGAAAKAKAKAKGGAGGEESAGGGLYGGRLEPLPPLLRVDAQALQRGPDCARSYIESLTITGEWVKARYPAGERHYAASPKFARPTHPRHKSYLLLGPGVKLVIIHGETDNGIAYLNFRASNLEKAGASIGGLLGDDDDDNSSWAEELPEACGGGLSSRIL